MLKRIKTNCFAFNLIEKNLRFLASQTRGSKFIEEESPKEIDGFRVFELQKQTVRRRRFEKEKRDTSNRNERYKTMTLNQDWTNVWPAASTFRQSVIPLPIHQGHVNNMSENGGVAPGKYGNAELMKIPNFFHLTPAHIKKHCEAIKKFCTTWPSELKTDADCERYFPIEIQTTDYVYDGPSIRDERARIVNLKILLDSLPLDEHARIKFIKLAGDRYDPITKSLTLIADKCPYRHQNLDYAKYLLSVLFFESFKVEEWENEMSEEDWLEYSWEKSKSKKNLVQFLSKVEKIDESKVDTLGEIKTYAKALKDNFDKGETPENIEQFKQSVLKLLKLNQNIPKTESTSVGN